MAEAKIVFLDTNVYLHYRRFDEVDWLDIVQAETVRIIVPPITMRELNKIKDTSPQPQIRRRAGNILKHLSKWFGDLDVAVLRKGIEIHLHPDEPMIDFAAYHLSRETQDDQLMASMIAYQLDNSENGP